jgi:fibronectin type 3 domain-containing protein
LNPSIAITVLVQFDPTVVGAASGTLTFKSNSTSAATSTIALSGTGATAQHEVSLTWSAPAKSPIPIAEYRVYRTMSAGSSFHLLSSVAENQTNYVDLTVAAGDTYTYYVTSVDDAGTESVPSNRAIVIVP